MQLYPLYQFTDDPDISDDDTLGGVVALPYEIPIEHIYRGDRLLALMEGHALETAFEVWACESLGLYDYAEAVAEAQGTDVGTLEAARKQFLDVWDERRGRDESGAGRAFSDQDDPSRVRLQAALKPFQAAGLPMVVIARYLGVQLRDVVMVTLGSRAAIRPEIVSLVEEELLSGALETVSERALCDEYEVSRELTRTLCELHGIDKRACAERRRHLAVA